jgi:NAD(P)-dependent dehydrogenase (short-subunit alcohol dehydrogenase family)
LTGRAETVVLVTGAGSGIGRAVTLSFAQQCLLAGPEPTVVATDVDLAAAQATAADGGTSVVALEMDVTDTSSVNRAFDTVFERFGRLDHAVNCAGVNCAAVPLGAGDEDDFDHTIAVNLKGVWRCLRREVAQMATQPEGGNVVNIASAAGLVGYPHAAPYVASKHAVVGLTKAAALDYAYHGVRVNAVCPGAVDTPMLAERAAAEPGLIEAMRRHHPTGRLVTVQEVTSAVLWLCSPGAASVTGIALPVDGGAVAR